MAYIKNPKPADARRAAFRPHLTAAATAVMALTALPAAAQGTGPGTTLPEVKVQGTAETYKADTVSSPKFTAPLLDTPQTITVIKKEVLQEQGSTTLVEALRNTPGVTILLGEGGNTNAKDNVFMRGFDATGSIFVDGVRQLGSFPRDTYNVEQIEVIKGPSGAEYGRVAPSGSINLSTKAARLENFFSGSVATGTDEQARLTADINRVLSETSAFRFNAMAQDSGVPGRDYVRNKGWAIAPSVAFGLNTPTRLTLSYEHVEQDNRPDGGIPTIGVPGYFSTTGTLASAPAVDRSGYYGSLNDFQKIRGDGFTARIEHDLGGGTTVRNTTYLGRVHQQQAIGSVGNPTVQALPYSSWTIARTRHYRDQTNTLLTNQTNVTATVNAGGVEHTLSGGVELIHEKQFTPTLVGGSLPPDTNLYSPVPGVVPFGAALDRSIAWAEGRTTTVAAYLFDTMKLSEQWQINGGLRLDRYRTTSDSVSTAGVPAHLKDSGTLPTYKVGAVYKPAPNGSIYAGYSVSQRPPGGENFSLSTSTTSADQAGLDPQKASNVELGTKWDVLDGKLALTAAVFRSENRNELILDSVTNTYTQIGRKTVRGIELGAVGQITPAWAVTAGLSLLDPEIAQGSAAQQGGVIQWTPKTAFTSWTTYKLPMGLTIGGGVRYVATVARSNNVATQNLATSFGQVPSYWVADAMGSYEISKNVTLQLNVYNLFDKQYVQSINGNGNRYTPGAPRSALVTANFKF
ncbi:MAG: catecholate siderophore receptor Fiu [Burkholderiaceae bacterium]|nr:catecholate siderophore receptor Fiu [Burkholderiaceae bacterium]